MKKSDILTMASSIPTTIRVLLITTISSTLLFSSIFVSSVYADSDMHNPVNNTVKNTVNKTEKNTVKTPTQSTPSTSSSNNTDENSNKTTDKKNATSIIKESIVKIFTVANQPDYQEPWNTSTAQFSGSGSIIVGNKILTNAHVIADNTFLEVKRYGQTKRFSAKVDSVSHDADLALLTVNDPKFFEGSTPLELGTLPTTQEEVVVYGFPTGGDTLSVTKGVVSRIEHQQYAHSSEYMLSVQIDAAINPGNSGGPVLSKGKIAGVVMQGLRGADNIGYMVPTPTIKHFFNDIKDGKYDGFPDVGIIVQEMENPGSRKKFKLSDNQTGVLAYKILFNSPANGIILPGDIITAIDGHKIADDGTVEFRPKEFTSFGYFIDQHQIGDTLALDIIRDSKALKKHITLTTTSKDFWLVQREIYDEFPSYFIFGGFVFTPVTKNYINAGMSFFGGGDELSELLYEWPSKDRREAVVVSQVLASDTNKGYHELYDWVVKKINGKTFKDFNEFYKLMASTTDEFITLEDKDGYKVIIDRLAAEKENKKILERYHIDAARSSDLDELLNNKTQTVHSTPVTDNSAANEQVKKGDGDTSKSEKEGTKATESTDNVNNAADIPDENTEQHESDNNGSGSVTINHREGKNTLML